MATHKRVYVTALGWADQLNTPEEIEARLSKFETWQTQSDEHADAYHLVERSRGEAAACGEQLKEWGIDERRLLGQLHERMLPRMECKTLWLALPTTALALLITVIAVSASLERIPWLRFGTSVGEVRTVILDDGSIVKLDTNSTLRARLSLARRDLVLERGRALFEVRPDWLRGFFVAVGHAVVSAKGTRFGVARHSDGAFETLVTQGGVKVSSEKGWGSDRGEIVLAAGQAALVSANGMQIDRLSAAELDHRLAWAQELDFDETLAQAVAEFNHYNTRQLVIDDPQLRDVPVVGQYYANAPDLFAHDLGERHHIAHSIGPNDTIHLGSVREASAKQGRLMESTR